MVVCQRRIRSSLVCANYYSHLEIFNGEYDPYIWACAAVWAFDRALRYGRILVINRFTMKSTARYMEEANVVKVTIPVRDIIRPKPGTYYYIYMVSGLKIWECHPFTLSSWESKTSNDAPSTLTFMFRVYNGFTRRVRERLEVNTHADNGSEKCQKPIRLLIEGPYGHGHTLSGYSSVLFIVGGLGVTVALSHLQALLESAARDENMRTRRIHVVWSVREEGLLQEVYEEDLAQWRSSDAARRFDLRLDAFVTGAGHVSSTAVPVGQSSTDKQMVSDETDLGLLDSGILPETHPSVSFQKNIFRHRPRVHDIVHEAAEACAMPEEDLAVVSCGPGALADDVRDAVVEALGRGYNSLDLYPETFTW